MSSRRTAEPAFEADRSVSAVTEAEMAALQPRSMPEALEETAGVHVQQTNRGAGSPIMRGLVGPANLILIDGVRFNNSTFRTGPNQYLSMLEPSSFERVEVMLGPGSVLYGSDAMGGVIQAMPRSWTGREGLRADGGARFSSADLSTAVWADAGWHGESAGALVGGTFRSFGTLRAGDGEDQPLSDYDQGAWRAIGRVALIDDLELGVTYLGARVRDAGRVDRLWEGRFRYYDNDDDLVYADLRWTPGGVLKELRVTPSFHRTWERVERFRCDLGDSPDTDAIAACLGVGDGARAWGPVDALLDPAIRQERNEDEVLTPGVFVTARLGFWEDRIRVTTGAEAYFDFVSSHKSERRADKDPAWEWQDKDRGNFSDDSTYRALGFFLAADGDLLPAGDHRLVLGLGGRVSNFAAHADDVPGLGEVEYDHTGFVGSASLRYLWRGAAMGYVTFSQGFRAPNLQESTVLGDTGTKFEVPNGDLDPERSDSIEMGARVNAGPVRAHVAGFVSMLDDVIDEEELTQAEWEALGVEAAVVGDKAVVRRVNAASGLYYGVEGSLEVGPFAGLTPWARVSWMRGEIERTNGETVPGRRIPPFMGTAALRYDAPGGRFWAEIYTRFAARQDRIHPSGEKDLRICANPDVPWDTYLDSGQGCDGTPGWVTVNVRGGYRFGDHLRLEAAVTNIGDVNYRYHGSGVDAPGFGATVTVSGSY